MSEGRIRSATVDGIMTLTIDRPEKKNALTNAMYEDLVGGLRSAAGDEAVRVAVVRGHESVFTAGNDLADFMRRPPTSTDSPVFQTLLALAEFPKPLVAAVTGPAVGLGTTMLFHCDFVYAGENARFHMPFVNLGLVPEGASSFLLPRIAGLRRASELLMLGDPFDAQVALTCGLVTEVVPDAQVFARAEATAKRLAGKPAISLQLTKQLLKQGTKDAVRAALHEEGALFMQRLVSPEAKQAFAAFFARKGT